MNSAAADAFWTELEERDAERRSTGSSFMTWFLATAPGLASYMTADRMATGDVHVTYRDAEDKRAVPRRGERRTQGGEYVLIEAEFRPGAAVAAAHEHVSDGRVQAVGARVDCCTRRVVWGI
jgi:hypothetical protein